jgi:hypothetical protein
MQNAHAVSKQTLDLDGPEQLGNAFQHLVLGQRVLANLDDVFVGGAATGRCVHFIADERQRLRIRQLLAFGTPPGELGSGEDGETVQLGRG